MKYDKPPLSFDQQADLLIHRGLIADRGMLIDRLKSVNYYRLSGYLYPYRQTEDTFIAGTTFKQVWMHYAFDRRLRLIVMDAVERVEVSIKTRLINALAHKTGAFGYVISTNLPNLSPNDHSELLKTLAIEIARSKETFVMHFSNKYGDCHEYLPLWMAGEVMSFGSALKIYRGVEKEIRNDIALFFRIPEEVLTSWLYTISVIRNICAHHSRLWNREFGGIKPHIPRKQKYPDWHYPISILTPARVPKSLIITTVPEMQHDLQRYFEEIDNGYLICKQDINQIVIDSTLTQIDKDNLLRITKSPYRIFIILSILKYLLGIIAPQSSWKNNLLALLYQYPEISRWSMGFPDNWQESPIWK